MKHTFIIPKLLCMAALSFSLCACKKDESIVLPDDKDPTTGVTFNLLDYGADNTGLNDCSDAFRKLFADIGDTKQVEIFIPAGRYKLNRRIVFDQATFSGYEQNKGLIVRGAGEDVTEMICNNEEGIFFFNPATNRITVTVCDLSCVSNRDARGTAIEFNTAGQNAGDAHTRMFQARNILIRGESAQKGFFKNGVLVYNAWYPMLDNVKMTGSYGIDATRKMDIGYLFHNCYSPLMTNCYFWGSANYGVRYLGERFEPEDGIIKDSYLVGQDYGVYVRLATSPAWAEPAFHISGCHIHYNVTGVYFEGVRQFFVSGNLVYCYNSQGSRWWARNGRPNETPKPYECRDIHLKYASDGIISNNQFTEPATPKRYAIDIEPESGNILIEGNIFNFDGTGIRNRSPRPSNCMGNVFGGEPDFTVGFTPYLDETGTLKKIDFE